VLPFALQAGSIGLLFVSALLAAWIAIERLSIATSGGIFPKLFRRALRS
jgi:hypothetical protein